MSLIPQNLRAQLIGNGILQRALRDKGADADLKPVVKLFTPDAAATWLLSEIDSDDEDLAFALCDLGLGCPELGYVSLSELAKVRGRLGLPVELDLYFKADKTIAAYAQDAARQGRILA